MKIFSNESVHTDQAFERIRFNYLLMREGHKYSLSTLDTIVKCKCDIKKVEQQTLGAIDNNCYDVEAREEHHTVMPVAVTLKLVKD